MKTITGDITKNTSGVLLNGVNCQHAMGSGVALAYLNMWPIVREQYMDAVPVLGSTDYVTIEVRNLYVANCYSQDFYGADGKQYADYKALFTSVYQAAIFAKRLGLTVKTPLIGAGLGGLTEAKVISILTAIETVVEVPFELFIL